MVEDTPASARFCEWNVGQRI